MRTHVELELKRNRGWPWPEASWGLTSMFGADGWCPACGIPLRQQSGSLTLQRKGLQPEGAWMPNWLFDTFCVSAVVADEVSTRFAVQLRPIGWHPKPVGDAMQLEVPTVGDAWFDEDELRQRAHDVYGSDGKICGSCHRWKWEPLSFEHLPSLRDVDRIEDFDVAASPEWFGSGLKAFRQVLFRRELAELIVAASPRDFRIREVS